MKLDQIAHLLKHVDKESEGCNCQLARILIIREEQHQDICFCTHCEEVFIVDSPPPPKEPEFKFAITMTGEVSVSNVFLVTAQSVEHATARAHQMARDLDFDDWTMGELSDHFHIETVEEQE